MKTNKNLIIPCFLLLLILTSCVGDEIALFRGTFTNLRERIAFSIDKASTQVAEGADVSKVLDWLEKELSDLEVNAVYSIPFIRSEAERLVILSALCISDLTDRRIRHYLQKLKAELITGDSIPPLPPHICSCNLSFLDLNAPQLFRGGVIYTGDFPVRKKEEWQAFLMKDDLQALDLSRNLHFQTYSLTLDLDGLSETFLEQFDYLSLLYNGEEVYATSILKKREEQPKEITDQLQFPSITFLADLCNTGDPDFAGAGPSVSINISFRITRKEVLMKIDFTAVKLATRPGTELSKACGIREYVLYHAPPGQHIEDVYMAEYDLRGPAWMIDYIDNDIHEDIFYAPFGQIVSRGDSDGPDIGFTTGVDIHFDKISHITLMEGN